MPSSHATSKKVASSAPDPQNKNQQLTLRTAVVGTNQFQGNVDSELYPCMIWSGVRLFVVTPPFLGIWNMQPPGDQKVTRALPSRAECLSQSYSTAAAVLRACAACQLLAVWIGFRPGINFMKLVVP